MPKEFKAIGGNMDADKLMSLQETILQAKEIIKNADAIVITAGAGMGVDSGLPDFRGDQGFWKAYPLRR